MKIEKNGVVYSVNENENSWTLSADLGDVSVSYKVSKSDCPDITSLRAFVMENDAI